MTALPGYSMHGVWIRGRHNVLIRADSIVVLMHAPDGLLAECVTGRTVRLTDAPCPSALTLALLEEIRRAGADDRRTVVIMPPAEQGSLAWRRECVDALLQSPAADGG